jgi:pimeloyl-ACP methyl ester carboxylesterase
MLKRVKTDFLSVAYEEHGAADGTPVLLLHGFPHDVRTYDEVAPLLVKKGCRVIAPYLRGYDSTHFLVDKIDIDVIAVINVKFQIWL